MSRAVRDNSKAVSLFPFLAVLLCTMGALLVLLVVLAEQASRVAATDEQLAAKPQVAVAAQPVQPKPVKPIEPPAKSEFELLRKRREQQLRDQKAIEKRLSQERAKLAHFEEHSRRLEHAVSELYLNNLQLEATEEDKEVDNEQAKRELARLKQLVSDTREQLEEMQKEAKRPKSYAIIPYRGPNGTFRPPMFIECTENAVIIQPGGTQLTEKDFIAPIRSSNALAAAIRATENHFEKQAAQTGGEPLEPYPLIIVRPSGHTFYGEVVKALKAADIAYGYEFIAEKKRIEFPAANPILANQQDHAVQFARLQQERLAKAAPRRFMTRVGVGGGSGHGGGYGSGVGGGDPYRDTSDRYATSGQGSDQYGINSFVESGDSANGLSQQGESLSGSSGVASGGAGSGEPNSGAGVSGSAAGSWENSDSLGGSVGQGAEGTEAGADGSSGSGGKGVPGGTQVAGSTAGQDGAAEGSGSANSGSQSTQSSEGSSGPGHSGSAQSQSNSASATFSNTTEVQSAAVGRGSDWALQKSRNQSVPMRRPISVYVRNDGLELLPSPEKQSFGSSKFIPFDQPTQKMLDEFAMSIRERTRDWGLAGRRMHWKPVLRLKIAPGADTQANKLAKLLEGSGVDVEMPLTAVRAEGGDTNVTR